MRKLKHTCWSSGGHQAKAKGKGYICGECGRVCVFCRWSVVFKFSFRRRIIIVQSSTLLVHSSSLYSSQTVRRSCRHLFLVNMRHLDGGIERCRVGSETDGLEDQRYNDQRDHSSLDDDVHDRVFEDNLPSLTSLSERVDRRSDLLRRSQPEQHGSV